MALGLMPGEHDWMSEMWKRDPLGRVAGIPQQPTGGVMDRLGAMFANPQQQAMLGLGLGLLAGANRGLGFGEAALGAFQNASNTYQGAMQNAFRNTALQRQMELKERAEEREQKKLERAERQNAAVTAGRISQGLGGTKDPMAYWRLVQNMPEVRETLSAYGIDPASITSPEQLQAIQQQLSAAGQIGGPYTKPGDMPSSVEEWQYYITLSPEQRRQYLEMKRNPNMIVRDVAGVPTVIAPSVTGTATTPLSTLPAEATAAATIKGAEKAAQTEAERRTEARLDFPRLEQNTLEAINIIDQLSAHPGLPYITGLFSKAPVVPNTPQAAADALAQQVQGQTFLRAYEMLKGGGQITEVEGRKAESAIARLNRAQSTKDYQAALAELRGVLYTGLERARRSSSLETRVPQPAGQDDPLGIR